MINQTDFARWAQRQHDELGLRPTLEPGGDYQRAHSPLPRGMADDVIPLHPLDHVIHDIYQSEAVGKRHFSRAHALIALYKTPNYWPLGWMDACDLYDKWSAEKHTDETCQRISGSLKGKSRRPRSLAFKRRMSAASRSKLDKR